MPPRPKAAQRSGRESPKPLEPPLSPTFDRIAACLDGSELGERALPHARAVAHALGARLTLLRVVERTEAEAAPLDPLEWDLRRREIRDYVARLAAEGEKEALSVETEVIEGPAAEEICLWARQHDVGLTVLCTHGKRGRTEWRLASTARKLVEGAPGSVLLVPASASPQPRFARYRRILVPLDGSPRAESVIPLARRLAEAQPAELILAYVVAAPELLESGPPDPEAVELRDRLLRHNQHVAEQYLDRLRARLADSGLSVRVLVLRGDDVRSRLLSLVDEEAVDLVVLSAHGRSARTDVSLGSVASDLVAHVDAPLLLVRRARAAAVRRVRRSNRENARLPSQASP